MASSRPGKRIFGGDTAHDIVSQLPWEIKDKILTKLPIKDAIRTSILSTKWRYAWASIPEIVVNDDDLIPTVNIFKATFHLVKIVDFLLFNHKGSILKFYLSTKYLCPVAFDRWILNLSRNGITDITFVLNLASNLKYRIPSNFFFCDALQYVELSRCLIELPHGFEGFKILRTLKLGKCAICAADLNWLVSSSPNLVKLILAFSQIKGDLRIISKGLTTLAIGDDFSYVQIDAPNLTRLLIGCSKYKTSPERLKCINNFCQSLGGLLNIRHIFFWGYSMLYLVDRSSAVLLNLCFTKLRKLTLNVDLANQKESSFTFSLLQNATKLEDLCLIVERSEITTNSSLWDKTIVLQVLRIVIIHKFKASESVLAFVKFILSSAPNLRKLALVEDPTASKEGNPETFKRLLKFERASTRAQIIFE